MTAEYLLLGGVVVGGFAVLGGAYWLSLRHVYISPATIAGDLFRYAKVEADTLVQVVGYDLYCLTSENYKLWRDALGKWVAKGARIECVLQECSPTELAALKKLKREFDPDNKVAIFRIDKTKIASDLLSGTKTFHWATFSQPDQLWIEGNHTPRNTEAHACEYVKAGRKDRRYTPLGEMFTEMKAAAELVA